MDASRRQFATLGAILAVLAGVIYWQATRSVLSPAEQAAARGPAAASPAEAAAALARLSQRASGSSAIPVVAIAALDGPQPEPSDTGRDPFRFGAAQAERGSVPAAGPGGLRSGAAPAPGAPGAQPEGPPPPPPIALKFIGTARQGAGRLYAVLRDERGVYYGADGDIVEGRFKILRVSANTVEVSYVDGRGRVSLPLSGGQP